MKRQRYGPGSWFAVPLRTEGFAVGLVARGPRRLGVCGYFFGPRRADVPEAHELSGLTPG
ncbi:hypothetical protein GCM10028814_20400 [Angustibacter aerolatus]